MSSENKTSHITRFKCRWVWLQKYRIILVTKLIPLIFVLRSLSVRFQHYKSLEIPNSANQDCARMIFNSQEGTRHGELLLFWCWQQIILQLWSFNTKWQDEDTKFSLDMAWRVTSFWSFVFSQGRMPWLYLIDPSRKTYRGQTLPNIVFPLTNVIYGTLPKGIDLLTELA